MRIKPAPLIFLLVLVFPVFAASNSLAATRTVEDVKAGIRALESAKKTVKQKIEGIKQAHRDPRVHVLMAGGRMITVRDSDIGAYAELAVRHLRSDPNLRRIVERAYPEATIALGLIDGAAWLGKAVEKRAEDLAVKQAVSIISGKLEKLERASKIDVLAIANDYETLLGEIETAIDVENKRREAILAGRDSDSVPAASGRACAPDGWDGPWKSNWNLMTLAASGNFVGGTYEYKNGQINGQLSDNGCRLRGVWAQEPTYDYPRDKGAFELFLSADGSTFAGKWGYGSDGNLNGGDWVGTKESDN